MEAVFDLVVVGSGGGGMVAALAAADAGARVLVLEKRDLIGGSTAMSGGVVWIPANPLLGADGIPDSYDDAMAHFEEVIGDVGPASSPERRAAFLISGPEMVSFLQRLGVGFERCDGYSDYYSARKGGLDVGRSIEPVPWDGHRLGDLLPKLQPGLAAGVGLAVKTNEVRTLAHWNRSLGAFLVAVRVVLRTWIAKARRQALLTNGASLIGQMLEIATERGVPVWTDCGVTELVVEDGRVVGVVVTKDGEPFTVRARRGVLLAAGGFAHNAEMRARYAPDRRAQPRWSIANPGDTGDAMQAAIELGAEVDLMDEAWWLPTPRGGKFGQTTLVDARFRPGAIFVDAEGHRFVNEANSYMEIGRAMYERDRTARAVPCWLVFDDGYRRRYSHGLSRPGKLPKGLIESGTLHRADTIAELAAECGIDPAGLVAEVERFNVPAALGDDPDFGRGASAYNRNMGDPGHRPNPSLGPLARAPFYAVEVVPSDIGTSGGLVTDADARVLRAGGDPIEGLYATGNITATVMGRHYLGAGASIANTMVFGYRAARHATAAEPANSTASRPTRPPPTRQKDETMSDKTATDADLLETNYFRSGQLIRDPYPYFEALRSECPVFQEPHHGVFMVTGHAEALAVYHDPDNFSSVNSVIGPFAKWPVPLEGDDVSDLIEEHRDALPFTDQLPSFDPPRHTAHRGLLMRIFTPRRLAENEEAMWDIARGLIDPFAEEGGCEFVGGIASPMAMYVIADLLGVPEEDRGRFREQLAAPTTSGKAGVDHSPLEFLYETFRAYIEDRRANPRDDALSRIAAAKFPDGSTPSVTDVMLLSSNLFAAGQETTVRLLSFTMQWLAEHPDLQAELREHRDRIPSFIEEALRYESPIKGDFRLAKRATEVGGVTIPAGSTVMVLNSAANRDERQFECPAEFRPDREDSREHLAFGHGVHFCLGASLARAEGRITVECMLDRFEHISLSAEHHGPPEERSFRYVPTYMLRGLSELHLELRPSAAS